MAYDGVFVRAGAVLVQVNGPARSVLSAERVALNFLSRLSGIATLRALEGAQTCVLDTRKTTPGLPAWRK